MSNSAIYHTNKYVQIFPVVTNHTTEKPKVYSTSIQYFQTLFMIMLFDNKYL